MKLNRSRIVKPLAIFRKKYYIVIGFLEGRAVRLQGEVEIVGLSEAELAEQQRRETLKMLLLGRYPMERFELPGTVRKWLQRELRRLGGRIQQPGQPDQEDDYSATRDEVDLARRRVDQYVQDATLGTLAHKVGDIGRAFEKSDEGTWGICDDCGRKIPEECLEGAPWTNTHFRQNWEGVDRDYFHPDARACSDYGRPDTEVLIAMGLVARQQVRQTPARRLASR